MRALASVALLGLLTACATQWAPGPGQDAANFEATKAQCSLVARHAGGSFAAYGSQNYVASAAAGYAIGEALRSNADFRDCMQANGFLPVTQQMVAAVSVKHVQIKGIVDQRRTCVEGIRSHLKYSALLPHLAVVSTGQYSMEQLTDEHLPSVAEASLLASYADDVKPCATNYIANATIISPAVGTVLSERQNESEAVLIQLVKRQISWGEAAQREKQNTESTQARLRTVSLL